MDYKGINLELLKSLTPQQKLEMQAQLLGYEKLPPTIEEFVNSDYYLGHTYGKGKLYKYWMPILKDIFPDNISTRYDTIVLTGCLGSGKSTISRLIAMYTYCRLDHLRNFNFFELAAGKNWVMSFFHTTNDTVANTFIDPLKEIRSESPYFTQGLLNAPTIDEMADTPRGKGPIGLDVILYVFSEINFIKPEVATKKLNTAFNRLTGRFMKARGYFGTIILDSSAAESGSFVDEFIEERCNPKTTKIVRSKIWEVKPHLYGADGWFKVYLGDSTRDAFIVESSIPGSGPIESLATPQGLDQDRMLEVPMDLLDEFKLDLNLSLNDHAGISTTSNEYFIQDRKALNKVFNLPFKNQEVIELDFYQDDRLYDSLINSIKEIPKDKVLSVRFDIGVVSDYTGLSICYFDEYIVLDKKNKTLVPKFVNPVTAAIGRIQGQETSITKLYQFVKDLSKHYEVGAITCDQFQSRQLIQDLKKDGFNAYEISVDRTDQPYQSLKLAIYEGRIKLPQSKLLQRELRELQYSRKNGKGKVDHPATTSSDMLTGGSGSKDCGDGLAGAIEAINRDLEIFTYLSKHFVRERYSEQIKKQTLINKKKIVKDAKKLMKDGGYKKFMEKEDERNKLINDEIDFKIPTTKKRKFTDLYR